MSKVMDLSNEALQKEIHKVSVDIANVKMQLELAKSDSAAGIYSDPVWFREATYALRRKGAYHQELLQESGRRNRAEKLARNNAFAQYFVEEARKVLPQTDFQYIVDRARSRGEE